MWCLAMVIIFFAHVHQLTQPDRFKRIWQTLAPLGIGILGFLVLPFRIDFDAAERAAFPVISANARPIVQALEEFKADNGQYPITISQLVPIYLRQLPYPGILGARAYSYRCPPTRFGGGNDGTPAYELYVQIGIEDVYFYVPDEAKRQRILKSGGFSLESENWIYLNT